MVTSARQEKQTLMIIATIFLFALVNIATVCAQQCIDGALNWFVGAVQEFCDAAVSLSALVLANQIIDATSVSVLYLYLYVLCVCVGFVLCL